MRRTPVVIWACIVALTLLLHYIQSADNIVSQFNPKHGFIQINWNNQDSAQRVYNYWKQSEVRTREVKILVGIDYGLMLVYCFVLFYIIALLRKRATITWINRLLLIAFWLVGLGTAVDAIQDARIYYLMLGKEAIVPDFRWMTFSKFFLLGLSLFIILLTLVSWIDWIKTWEKLRDWKIWTNKVRFIISQALKCVWVFFPAIFFLLVFIFCFWTRGQGKDIIIAFKENKTKGIDFGMVYWNYTRLIFFVAIGFWAYVTWYTARIIAYIKSEKQIEPLVEIETCHHPLQVARAGKTYPEISTAFFDNVPRMLGSACFILLEIAVLQSPIFDLPLGTGISLLLFVELSILHYYVNKWILLNIAGKRWFRRLFFNILGIFGTFLFLACTQYNIYFMSILGLLMLLHIVYIFYNNLHRVDLQSTIVPIERLNTFGKTLIEKSMRIFCLPVGEYRYYTWFFRICLLGIVFYMLAIFSLSSARYIGPFPFVILAFGVLLTFTNVVTAFSIKTKINLHLVLFILAILIGLKENHRVRVDTVKTVAAPRATLPAYLKAWLDKNDSSGKGPIEMYFVMSNGGASRSGYWTAAVLGAIEDSTLSWAQKRFSRRLFCLSGTSGGGVGVACYFAALRSHDSTRKQYVNTMHQYLQQDYFTQSFARLLGPDFFRYLALFSGTQDRAAVLEESFETSAQLSDSLLTVPMGDQFSAFPALVNNNINLPILCINTTRVQDGNPGVVSNLVIDSTIFNNRVDVVKLLPPQKDMTLATAAIMGARFPYISPAGNLQNNDFVDGGYFDNSGAGVVQEMIHGILLQGKDTSNDNIKLHNQIERIRFNVLHIVNSPINTVSKPFDPVPPLQNDLFAPVLTILGAYDMQTTVNDQRLKNYLLDLGPAKAHYARLSLYESNYEWAKDRLVFANKKEPEYSMNWFMSDTLVRRIQKRLIANDSLYKYINSLK